MTGRRGCLGRLVLLILLAWPIEELAGLFGWSDATTGYVLLGAIALLAVGASGQREGIAVKRGEAREVRAALFRGRYRIWQARGMSAPRHERPGDRPMHERGELGGEAGNAPAGGGGILFIRACHAPAIPSQPGSASGSSLATASAAATAAARAAHQELCSTSTTWCRRRPAEPRARTTCALRAKSATSARVFGSWCRPGLGGCEHGLASSRHRGGAAREGNFPLGRTR